MTVKEWLEQNERIGSLILSASREIKELQSLFGKSDESLLLQSIESLEKEISELLQMEIDIKSVISSVEDFDQQLCLRLRYLCFYSWAEVQSEMDLSEETIFRLHKKALNTILLKYPDKFLEEGEKDESKH